MPHIFNVTMALTIELSENEKNNNTHALVIKSSAVAHLNLGVCSVKSMSRRGTVFLFFFENCDSRGHRAGDGPFITPVNLPVFENLSWQGTVFRVGDPEARSWIEKKILSATNIGMPHVTSKI